MVPFLTYQNIENNQNLCLKVSFLLIISFLTMLRFSTSLYRVISIGLGLAEKIFSIKLLFSTTPLIQTRLSQLVIPRSLTSSRVLIVQQDKGARYFPLNCTPLLQPTTSNLTLVVLVTAEILYCFLGSGNRWQRFRDPALQKQFPLQRSAELRPTPRNA